MSPEYLQRFSGIARTYGQQALHTFSRSHVSVIGLGGVGSWAAEALARSGIGTISLFDLDDICISNTNRQIHALKSSTGKQKTDEMRSRLLDINPEINCNAINQFVTVKNVAQVLSTEMDYIFDATDSVKAKTAIIAHCKRNKISIICSGGAGGQLDPSQIKLADLSKTIQDPLAAKVRHNLRRNHHFSSNPKRKFGVDCVYSTEQLRYPQPDGTVCNSKPANQGPSKLDCQSGFGAITPVTATFAMFATAQILQKLASRSRSQQHG